MSKELKAIKQGSVELGEYWVYDADDVDALLAKKEAEIARLEALRKVHVEAITSMKTRLHQGDKKIRRLCRALCRLRIGFAKHFGRVNSGKKDCCLLESEGL